MPDETVFPISSILLSQITMSLSCPQSFLEFKMVAFRHLKAVTQEVLI